MIEKGKLSILIVDDHKIFRDGLKQLLDHFSYVGIVKEASNGKEFLEIIDTVQFDIVFLDIEMPIMNGIEASQKAKAKYPDIKIIALTTFHDEEYLDQMMISGVSGYMLKRSTMEEFDSALNRVYAGGNFFSDEIMSILTRNINKSMKVGEVISKKPLFSDREFEILKLICKGLNNDQIADMVHLSPKTVEKHKSSLFQKTGNKNTVNLIIYALTSNLLTVDDLNS